MDRSDGRSPTPRITEFRRPRGRRGPARLPAAVRAMLPAAMSGNGSTELTLISHKTYVSWPDASSSPSRKSASQIAGNEDDVRSRTPSIDGTHDSSIIRRSPWNLGAVRSCIVFADAATAPLTLGHCSENPTTWSCDR
jgi:hypothetical protein